MSSNHKYGLCAVCNTPMEPVWFKEEEYSIVAGRRIKTGRTRKACSHLVCPVCLTEECVDDTFDMSWSK